MQQRIGILGGTFNPIHFGHLAAAEEVRERLGLDLVLFTPTFVPPHKQDEPIPSADHRLQMVRLAISGNERFAVSDREVKRGGKSYTIQTIEELRSHSPETEFFFITGLDSFIEIGSWKSWKKLLKLCTFVVLSRPGYRFSSLHKLDFLKNAVFDPLSLDTGRVKQASVAGDDFNLFLEVISHFDISSTDIRKRVRQGRSIKYLLPEAIEHYIITNKLYG